MSADICLRSGVYAGCTLPSMALDGSPHLVYAPGRQLGLGQLRSLNGIWNVGCEAGEG